MTTVITYGTFDLFHIGHLNLLQRARALGSRLVVGISTDEFNAIKNKRSIIPFQDRQRIVEALGCVDGTFGEANWDQKRDDIVRTGAGILAMGEDEAKSLGVNTTMMTGVIITAATLITAAAVCIAGLVGWVGLVVPHIARMIVGPDYKKILPASILIGAAYLLAVDDIARTLTTAEIPLGILTALIGAPVFAYLRRVRKVGWECSSR